jgi:hypothetical protein
VFSSLPRTVPPATRATLIITLVAALAMAPELAIGLTVTDNFRFNLVWPEQFVELFRSGHLYPRWLPRCWGGMGSPVFYFYPPLVFWVTALVDTVSGGAISSERLVPFASLILLTVSGVAMRSWLRTRVGETRALLGAIAYMLAPYHLYDLYGRGALAEASAYASVPVVMLALARLGDNRPRFVPVLAVAFAALLFSHLPTALLVGLFLIAPYVAFIAVRAARPMRFLIMALAGGLTGIMLAAVFVVPALALLPHVSPNALSGSFYRPENWFFWHIRAGSMGGRMLLIVPICIAAFLFAAAAIISRPPEQSRREPLFWAGLTIVLVSVVAGLIPPVWRLPGLALVQFPWRALLLVEFTTVTLLVTARQGAMKPLVLGGAAVLGWAYIVLALIGGHMIGRTWNGQQQTAAEIRAEYQDAPEYLPAGSRIDQGEGPDDVHITLPVLPPAMAADRRATIATAEARDGGMAITVDSPAPTQVAVRRFYFPHWQLHDDVGRPVAIVAKQERRVVSFRAPAGRSAFRLEVGAAPYESLGRAMTLIALLALIALAGASAVLPIRPLRRPGWARRPASA